MKYSQEFKLDCVKKYKNGEHIEDPPGTKHESFLRQVRRWTRIYDSLGEIGLSCNRPKLSIEEILILFTRVENGESYTSAANSQGIQEGQLIRWHRIYLEKGIDGLKSLKRGRKPMKKNTEDNSKLLENMSNEEKLKYYQERNKYLEAENEYLKKLDALVQKRENRQPKKK